MNFLMFSGDDLASVQYNIRWDTLMEWQRNIENITGFALGIISFAIVVFTSLVTAADILYLTSPIFNGMAHKMNWDGSLEERRFRFISPQAVEAQIEANTRTTGKSVLATYMRKRSKQLLISTIVLVFLLIGHGAIIGIVVKIVVGFLKAFWLY